MRRGGIGRLPELEDTLIAEGFVESTCNGTGCDERRIGFIAGRRPGKGGCSVDVGLHDWTGGGVGER